MTIPKICKHGAKNCRLIIQDGEISPRVYKNSIKDWGASVSSEIVTWRSSLGLDPGGKTLYYFAGPSMSVPALADAMRTVGVGDGMLLDINDFWVHFTAIHSEEGELVPEPLLPKDMKDRSIAIWAPLRSISFASPHSRTTKHYSSFKLVKTAAIMLIAWPKILTR